MRRKIQLYIDGQRADVSDQGLVLFNYAVTDLSKPTVVRNSYSQQVTLPGTAANAAIFGVYSRPDRVTSTEGFNALQRTPFAIYDELSQVLVDGYLRLDEVQRKGEVVTGYKVTLFGGLGAFFQALSYDDNGDTMSLADLNYLGGTSPDSELDFTIGATAVSNAWARLRENAGVITTIWDVINFAPCYEGYPDGDFDADKGYGSMTGMGLSSQSGFSPDLSGGCRVNLSEKVDMWAAKDLRSYLQRPVLNVLAFLKAAQRRAAERGYTFDYSDLDSGMYFYNMWKTLPLLPSLGTFNKVTGDLTDVLSYAGDTFNYNCATWTLSNLSSSIGVDMNVTLGFVLKWKSSSQAQMNMVDASKNWASVVFLQLEAFDGNGNLCGVSDVTMLGPDSATFDAALTARVCGYTPVGNPNYSYVGTHTVYDSGNWQKVASDIFMTVNASSITYIELHAHAYRLYGTFNGNAGIVSKYDNYGSAPSLWTTGGSQVDATSAKVAQSATPDVLAYTVPDKVRSGARITKQMLLSGDHTPADYLIGMGRLFGWMFLYDEASKTVKVMPRDGFYQGGTTIDLSDRIDRSRGMTIRPLNIESKWYLFSLPMAEGSFAKEYKDTYGFDYGIQKVDTGYGFNAESINLLEGSALRAAVSKQAHGKYWYIFKYNGSVRPVMFLNAGCTYTLYDADGGEKNFDTPILDASLITMTSYSSQYAGYDVEGAYRLDLADGDGKAVNGEDVLVWYNGYKAMKWFKVSDDTSAMLTANGGRPCWNLDAGGSDGVNVPLFTRYKGQYTGNLQYMLDFGRPLELDIPNLDISGASSLYEMGWKNYLGDLLNMDTKVMECRVRLDGLQVNQSLLRNFFWYENSLWVLNRIKNYSLTTFDTAECEFVQVRDKANYTNGQL